MTGLPIVGFYYWTMNQYVIQRVLGSRDIAAAGRASMIAAALKLLPLFLMTIPGAMAVALLPGLDHPDKVFPTMVATFTPSGLTGLILAGVIAALMSTCSATLNSAATLITMDFVQPHKPGITQRQLVRTARIATVVITLIAATWAPMIQHFQGLWSYLQQVFAFVASPLVATFLMGLWMKRLGPSAALRGLIRGHVLSVLLFIAREAGLVTIHFTIIAGIICTATALLTWLWMVVLGTRDTPDPRGPRVRLVDRTGIARVPCDVRWTAAAILVATSVIIIVFW